MTTTDTIKTSAEAGTEPGTMSQASVTDTSIHDNDAHWTASGSPAMDAVNALLPTPITRARLDEVAPNFKRDDGVGGEPQPPIDNEHVAEGAAQFLAVQELHHQHVAAVGSRLEIQHFHDVIVGQHLADLELTLEALHRDLIARHIRVQHFGEA